LRRKSQARFSLLIALVCAALIPAAAVQADDMPDVPFEKHTLDNGLQLILHVDRKLPIVHVNQWFHVGSKNEKLGRTGFAHLFEHIMFQGSKNAAGEYFTYVENAGANLREGGVNGTTNNDRTNYFATVPSANLETILWLEADRLATLADALDEEKLDNQRDVVKNERRQSLENRPYGRAFKLIAENLYPSGHPYSWSVIGSHADLTAASVDDVKEFFKRYYTPNNLSLVIAGDFDPAEAKALVEKYFGSIPPGPALDRPARWIPTLSRTKFVEVADRVAQERAYMVWPAPQWFGDDEAPLDMTSAILTDGLSSRLNKALVYDRQLCSSVSSFNFAAEIAGMFAVIATVRPGESLDEVESIVASEIARLATEGPSMAELTRAKTKQEYRFVSGLERIGGFGGKSDLLNNYNTYAGDPGLLAKDVQRYRVVTTADVKRVASQWLDTDRRLHIRFRPEASKRPPEVALDRSLEPPLGEDRPFTTPEVQSATLDNGVEVHVVERHDLPKVAVTLVTRAGAVCDPKGKAGNAHLVVQNIDMGTSKHSSLELVDALGDLGTSLTGNAGRESARVGFEVLQRNLEPALGLMAEVVLGPEFPQAEFDREKQRHLDSLAQADKNPNAIASRVRGILAFGPDHPYGRPTQGLRSTIDGIERADLVRFHEQYWKPGGSALVFVGDVTLAEAKRLAGATFGGWSGGAPPELDIPEPDPAPRGLIYLVDHQGAAQTVISQFLPAPKRASDGYYALRLADSVWGGGGFGTRLNLNLREDKGYSYGVFSNLALYREGGLWYAGGGVQTDKTKESVVEFDKELGDLTGDRPISSEEFEVAKSKRIRGYAQQFESLRRIATQIADLWTLELPMAELARESTGTAAASLKEVRAAATRYSIPGEANLLLVGDRAKVEEGVRSLGLGDVVVLDVEGNKVAAAQTGQLKRAH